MNFQEFTAVMKRFADGYGTRFYPEPTTKAIFEIVKWLSMVEFDKVLQILVDEHTRAPVPANFRKAAAPFLKTAFDRHRLDQVKAASENNNCARCGNTGMIMALLRENPRAEYAFRCSSCAIANSRNIGNGIPTWGVEFKDRYIPVACILDSLTKARAMQRPPETTTRNASKSSGDHLRIVPDDNTISEYTYCV